jgi:hypothetical protein
MFSGSPEVRVNFFFMYTGCHNHFIHFSILTFIAKPYNHQLLFFLKKKSLSIGIDFCACHDFHHHGLKYFSRTMFWNGFQIKRLQQPFWLKHFETFEIIFNFFNQLMNLKNVNFLKFKNAQYETFGGIFQFGKRLLTLSLKKYLIPWSGHAQNPIQIDQNFSENGSLCIHMQAIKPRMEKLKENWKKNVCDIQYRNVLRIPREPPCIAK